MGRILLFFWLAASAACSDVALLQNGTSTKTPVVTQVDKVSVHSGDTVTIEGVNLGYSIVAKIDDVKVPLSLTSSKNASLVVPESTIQGLVRITFSYQDKVFATYPFLMNVKEEAIKGLALKADQVCDDIVFNTAEGPMRGTRSCNASLKACSSDGQTACIVDGTNYAAGALTGAAAKIASGQTLVGVSGSATLESHAPCSGANQTGCLATSTYKTMDLSAATSMTDLTLTNFNATVSAAGNFEFWDSVGGRHQVAGDANLTAGKIKSGVSIFGATGQYPSTSYRLSTNTASTDLTLFTSQITTDGSFEFFDSAGQVYSGSGDSDLIAANIRSGTAIESLSISGTMPAVLPVAPTPLATNFQSSPNQIVLTWTNTGAAGYLVVARVGAAVTFNPTRATAYATGAQGSDTILYVGAAATYTHSGVTPGTNYYYAVYSYDANNFYSLTAATGSNSATSCTGLAGGTWVLVPGDATYGTSDFCVMKYEAKDVSSVATSQAALSPWVNISQTAAITACQALGSGYSLISNADWLTLGANIANVASNWSTGSVGTGAINRGHSDNNPASACPASTDDSLGWVQTDCTAKNSSGDVLNQKRTHTLSNGGVVWDLAGNVWDWTSDVIPNISAKPYGSADGSPVNAWREFTTVNSGFSSMTRGELTPTNAQKAFWNDSWASSTSGMGQYYSGTNGSGGALARGALWFDGTAAGLFAVFLSYVPSDTYPDLGFRCVVR